MNLLTPHSNELSNTQLIGLVDRGFTNGLGDLGSIPGRVIPKTLKMVLDTSLINTQQYKVRIEGKVEQSRERSSAVAVANIYNIYCGGHSSALLYTLV